MAEESFTVDQLNKLKKAISQGALTVEYADKKVTYRSLNEMIRIKQMIEAEINGGSDNCNDGVSYMEFNKGL